MTNSGLEVDYIIVGHGLAGALLAQTLRSNNASVLVVESEESEDTSSRIAAGMFNPVTGNRIVKTWQADVLFPFLHEFYSNLEKETGAKFFHPMPIFRPYRGIDEQNAIISRSEDSDLAPWVDVTNKEIPNNVSAPFGGFYILNGGYVNTVTLLDTLKQIRLSERSYRIGNVHINDVAFNDNHVKWNNIRARKLIFCNGYMAANNTFFNGIPFSPLKGETLVCNMTELDENKIINGGGAYVVPLGNSKVRIGATYQHIYQTELPTEEGKASLLGSVNSLIVANKQVLSHHSGLRPAVKDRRPVIGLMPNNNLVAIFNGMGSKGVSLIPWLASQFTEFLLFGKPLPIQADIARFKG